MEEPIRAVVFDLDGTLADTADLTDRLRRVPADVLGVCPPGSPPQIDFDGDVALTPGLLIAAGYKVGIVTRSPNAYASSVIGLLRLDWQELETSVDPNVSLRHMATRLEVPISQILYVADRAADEAAARECGTQYLRAPWINGGTDEDLWDHPNFGPGYAANAPKPRQTPDYRFLNEHASLPAWVSAMSTLLDYPGYRGRRRFQLAFLRDVPGAARKCVMPRDGRIFWPEIVTHAERLCDPELDKAVVEAVGRLFPAVPIGTDAGCAARACVPYTGVGEWGSMLAIAKAWSYHHSGKEVLSNQLELPATAIAAALRSAPDGAMVVPVAASPFNEERPGQASLRIAYRAASLSERAVLELLEKHHDEQRCRIASRGQSVVLVDDQVTSGQHLGAAVQSLSDAGYVVQEALAWSASRQGAADIDGCALAEWTGLSYGSHPVRCRVHAS